MFLTLHTIDLAPLSYVAGVLTGNASLYVYDGPKVHGRREIIPSPEALKKHGLNTVTLQPKEHLAILNGTAFSASLAALCLHDAVRLAALSLVCTAMGTEALLGARGSYDRFIHDVARPHPGQVDFISRSGTWNMPDYDIGPSSTDDMGTPRRQPVCSTRRDRAYHPGGRGRASTR